MTVASQDCAKTMRQNLRQNISDLALCAEDLPEICPKIHPCSSLPGHNKVKKTIASWQSNSGIETIVKLLRCSLKLVLHGAVFSRQLASQR